MGHDPQVFYMTALLYHSDKEDATSSTFTAHLSHSGNAHGYVILCLPEAHRSHARHRNQACFGDS